MARRQFGVVTTQQAIAAGLTPEALRVLQARGVLVRRFRGVYAFLAAPDSREARWLAAQFAIGRSGILSHTTAAAAHGLPISGTDDGIHITVPRRSRLVPAGVVVHPTSGLR